MAKVSKECFGGQKFVDLRGHCLQIVLSNIVPVEITCTNDKLTELFKHLNAVLGNNILPPSFVLHTKDSNSSSTVQL